MFLTTTWTRGIAREAGIPPGRAPQGITRTHGIGATALARMGRTPTLKTARAASPVPEGGTAP